MAFPRPYGRYILEERLAMGGMAEIFRARTATAGFEKKVCIKRVLPHFLEDEDFVTMFRDEGRTAGKLQHANVVQVFDFGEVDDGNGMTLYLAMELVEGTDLRRIAEASRKKKIELELGEVVQIGIDVCRGLHHAHSLQEGGKPLGIVHRDVSPHNILVSRQGEVKVTDFGIAKAAERATHTSTGIVKGKVAYMSPEQAEGKEFDHRLDQWAVGVVLWELLCGERLFRGDNDATILRKVMNVEVPRPSKLRGMPTALEDIVLRALQGEPRDRFPDLRQMELALSRFLFSGLVDPATAEVRNVFPRIVDAGPEPAVKRTSLLPAPAIEPAAPLAPKTERLEDAASVIATAPDEKAATSSSTEESQVFVSSGALRAAPGPPTSAPTVMSEDPRLFDDAVSSLEKQQSQKNAPSPATKTPSTKSKPSPRAPHDTVVSVVSDGALAREAERVTAPLPPEEGTPATRTLVPSQLNSQALEPAPGRLPSAAPSIGRGSRSERPLLAAAAILAVGLVVAAIIVSGFFTVTPVVALATPPAAPTPPPIEPPVAVAPAPPPAPRTPAPPPASEPPIDKAVEAPLAKAVDLVSEKEATTTTTTTEKQPKAEKPGSVYIDVPGSWADVFIGKNPMGQTPVTLQLKPGRYNITLRNDEAGKKRTVPVTIVSGVKTKIDSPL